MSSEEMKSARLQIAVAMCAENPDLVDKVFDKKSRAMSLNEEASISLIRAMIEIDLTLGQQLKVYVKSGGARPVEIRRAH